MFLVPHQVRTYSSPLLPEQVLSRLREVTDLNKQAFRPATKEFYGRIGIRDFAIRRSSLSRNHYLPRIGGTVTADVSGAAIRAVYSLPLGTLAYFGVLLLAGIVLVPQQLKLVFAGILLALHALQYFFAFKPEADRASVRLEELWNVPKAPVLGIDS